MNSKEVILDYATCRPEAREELREHGWQVTTKTPTAVLTARKEKVDLNEREATAV